MNKGNTCLYCIKIPPYGVGGSYLPSTITKLPNGKLLIIFCKTSLMRPFFIHLAAVSIAWEGGCGLYRASGQRRPCPPSGLLNISIVPVHRVLNVSLCRDGRVHARCSCRLRAGHVSISEPVPHSSIAAHAPPTMLAVIMLAISTISSSCRLSLPSAVSIRCFDCSNVLLQLFH